MGLQIGNGQVKDSELYAKQDMKCTYNVTLWRVQIFACVSALIICHAKCISSSKLHPVASIKYCYYYSMYIHLNYYACKSNALLHIMFDHLWSTWICLDFHNDLANGTVLEKKKKFYVKYVFWFWLQLSYENFFYSGTIQWDIINVPHTSSIMSNFFFQL